MKVVVCAVLLLGVASAFPENVVQFEQPRNGGKHWAFLVAGSNGYFNYRHQADVCHAYQIMKRHGIPDENIIVMMYDDIADNRENPVKNNIINKPDGPNVYDGVLKDYTGRDVNPETFLNVLKGKKDEVSGKVVDSGPDDHVFVNFVDHGAPGILGFGTKTLKAKDLMDAIMYMHDNNRYAKLVLYVEACESGSMFEDLLPKDINAFATTAANAHESSYACYFDQSRKTYLGDVYSIKWMQDSDKEDLNTETLQKQFLVTKAETNTSHVQEYGDLSMGDMTVAEFQGEQVADYMPTRKDPCEDAVKSEDVPVEILKRSLDLVSTKEEAEEIREQLEQLYKAYMILRDGEVQILREWSGRSGKFDRGVKKKAFIVAKKMQERDTVDKVVKEIVAEATSHDHLITTLMMEKREKIRQWTCYEKIVDHLIEACPDHLQLPQNDYALRKLYMFVNMCEANIPLETMISAVNKVCEKEN